MKLKDWCQKYGMLALQEKSERKAVQVIIAGIFGSVREKANDEIYQLDDYKVSSHTANVVWLLPIPSQETDDERGKPDEHEYGGEG